MSVRRVQYALIAILVATGSAIVLTGLLRGCEAQTAADAQRKNAPRYTVLRLLHDARRGDAIAADDAETVDLASAPAPGALSYIAPDRPLIALRDLRKGEALTANDAAAPGQLNLARLIPPGLRAISLRVGDESSVANLIRPDDHVDVLIISNPAREGEAGFARAEARIVLQNIRVLAVGGAALGDTQGEGAYRNVTLAVTPRQAALLMLARNVGVHYLSLRGTADDAPVQDGVSVSSEDLRPERAAAQSGAPAAPRHAVEVIAGSKKATMFIAGEGAP